MVSQRANVRWPGWDAEYVVFTGPNRGKSLYTHGLERGSDLRSVDSMAIGEDGS